MDGAPVAQQGGQGEDPERQRQTIVEDVRTPRSQSMSQARHPMPAEVAGLSLEEIAKRYIARFKDRKPDWNAFEDAKIEGYKRAQHRFIGAGGSGKHGDQNVIPPRGFTLS